MEHREFDQPALDWPGVTTSKSNQCVLVNSPEDLHYQVLSGVASGCESGTRIRIS